jgi:hypothetical protein
MMAKRKRIVIVAGATVYLNRAEAGIVNLFI